MAATSRANGDASNSLSPQVREYEAMGRWREAAGSFCSRTPASPAGPVWTSRRKGASGSKFRWGMPLWMRLHRSLTQLECYGVQGRWGLASNFLIGSERSAKSGTYPLK